MQVTIRDARAEDAALIAWVQMEASRSGRPLGFWDLVFPGADRPRLALIEKVVCSPHESFVHFGGFLIAEVDGQPAGALSGYAPGVKKLGHFMRALSSVLTAEGWSEAHQALIGGRITPFMTCLSDTPLERWVVEWVALTPQARGKGVAARLLDAVMERGRAAGFDKAQIAFLIGNDPAQRSYERAGFAIVDEKRDAAFEALFGAPGTARMWRGL